MTEPTLTSQLLGVASVFICLFVAMLIVANNEQKRQRQKEEQEKLDQAIIDVYQQGRNQFNNIARENIRNCDRKFTFDTQAPVGLRADLLALPQPKE
nr:MAG TPA: Geopilin domain 1 protein, PilA, bacterial nanowire, type [Caudoviricetes sp.]